MPVFPSGRREFNAIPFDALQVTWSKQTSGAGPDALPRLYKATPANASGPYPTAINDTWKRQHREFQCADGELVLAPRRRAAADPGKLRPDAKDAVSVAALMPTKETRGHPMMRTLQSRSVISTLRNAPGRKPAVANNAAAQAEADRLAIADLWKVLDVAGVVPVRQTSTDTQRHFNMVIGGLIETINISDRPGFQGDLLAAHIPTPQELATGSGPMIDMRNGERPTAWVRPVLPIDYDMVSLPAMRAAIVEIRAKFDQVGKWPETGLPEVAFKSPVTDAWFFSIMGLLRLQTNMAVVGAAPAPVVAPADEFDLVDTYMQRLLERFPATPAGTALFNGSLALLFHAFRAHYQEFGRRIVGRAMLDAKQGAGMPWVVNIS
jgi:hypothetical protein